MITQIIALTSTLSFDDKYELVAAPLNLKTLIDSYGCNIILPPGLVVALSKSVLLSIELVHVSTSNVLIVVVSYHATTLSKVDGLKISYGLLEI